MLGISVVDRESGRTVLYSPAELREKARDAVKGKGRLTSYWVSVDRAGTFSSDVGPNGAALIAQYQLRDGWSMSVILPL